MNALPEDWESKSERVQAFVKEHGGAKRVQRYSDITVNGRIVYVVMGRGYVQTLWRALLGKTLFDLSATEIEQRAHA